MIFLLLIKIQHFCLAISLTKAKISGIYIKFSTEYLNQVNRSCLSENFKIFLFSILLVLAEVPRRNSFKLW
jgi:hypothetical protein